MLVFALGEFKSHLFLRLFFSDYSPYEADRYSRLHASLSRSSAHPFYSIVTSDYPARTEVNSYGAPSHQLPHADFLNSRISSQSAHSNWTATSRTPQPSFCASGSHRLSPGYVSRSIASSSTYPTTDHACKIPIRPSMPISPNHAGSSSPQSPPSMLLPPSLDRIIPESRQDAHSRYLEPAWCYQIPPSSAQLPASPSVSLFKTIHEEHDHALIPSTANRTRNGPSHSGYLLPQG